MKRLLTKGIAAGILAGTMLAPTAAHALPYNPIGIARGAADYLPVNPFKLVGPPGDVVGTATSKAGSIREALPVDPVGMATSAVGNIRQTLPVDPVSTATSKAGDTRKALPVDPVSTATSAAGSIQKALPVDPVAKLHPSAATPSLAGIAPPVNPCGVTHAVNLPAFEIARRLIPSVAERLC